jgi:hypothetical protein
VVKTAVAEKPKGTPEEWQDHVLAWAKENGSGEYRLGYWEGYDSPTSTTTTCGASGGFRAATLFLGAFHDQGERASAPPKPQVACIPTTG